MNAGPKAEPGNDLKNSSLLPMAWQPLTPRGVAAFVEAPFGRIFLVEFFFALLAAASVIWFLHDNIFPTVREAVRNLPDSGAIRQGHLQWHAESPKLLASSHFLSVVVDEEHNGREGREAQACVELGRDEVRLISLLGYLEFNYPEKNILAFNRPELEPWWGAWQPMSFVGAALFTIAYLFVCWGVLATIYCPAAKLVSFFANRELSWGGSWRLSAAALMPGALFLILGIVAYGLGLIDLIRFAFAFGFHLFIGWVFIFIAPFFLPRNVQVEAQRKNPFA